MTKLKPGEIVHANLTFKLSNGKTHFSKEKIFSREYKKPVQVVYDQQKDNVFLKKHGIDNLSAELIGIEIIKKMGFKQPEGMTYSVIKTT